MIDPHGLWCGRPGPSGLLAGRKHGFLMWVPDLLATGQPSEVKRVWLRSFAGRVKVPGVSDTFDRLQLPLNQALWTDRQKTGPGTGLPPPLPDSPSREPLCPCNTSNLCETLGDGAAMLPVLGALRGRCWGPRREAESPTSSQAGGGHLCWEGISTPSYRYGD